jgi:hypothetical protein
MPTPDSFAISIAVSMASVAWMIPRPSSPWTCAVTGPVRVTTGTEAALIDPRVRRFK